MPGTIPSGQFGYNHPDVEDKLHTMDMAKPCLLAFCPKNGPWSFFYWCG